MIFLIPARAGSKRLPGKNKRLFCGLPLWYWSYATAMRLAGPGDTVEVSSDDLAIARATGCRRRDPALALDNSSITDLVDAFLILDDVCLLQPTSPTRTDTLVKFQLGLDCASRSTTNGRPNGQCYVYRSGQTLRGVETEKGHDIDTLADFEAAEKYMMERFK